MSCSICLSDIKNKTTTQCGHTFCKKCITVWNRTSSTCPMCRSQIQITTRSDRVETRSTTADKRLINLLELIEDETTGRMSVYSLKKILINIYELVKKYEYRYINIPGFKQSYNKGIMDCIYLFNSDDNIERYLI